MLSLAGKFLNGETRGWMVLRGASGAGKTHLMCALALGLCALGIEALYEPADLFLEKCRDSENGVLRDEDDSDMPIPISKRMSRYRNVPVLLLDDIRADQMTTAWQVKMLDSLVDARYSSGAPTVFSTNCTDAELGERMARRMKDRELVDALFCEAP
jgi:primosomal protein DnaI